MTCRYILIPWTFDREGRKICRPVRIRIRPNIIIELERIPSGSSEDVAGSYARKALERIRDRDCTHGLVGDTLLYGIASRNKKATVLCERISQWVRPPYVRFFIPATILIPMMDCEWMVIGAGPSGCTAAMTLTELGEEDVIVLERLSPEAHGRYHSICGEAVSDRMFRDIGYTPDCAITRVSSISIDFPGTASISIPVEGSIIDRNAMLADLRSRSSARFIRGTVTSIDRDGDSYLVHTADETYRCRHLIGADGAHSVVRRDVFKSTPEEVVPIINHIVEGEATPGMLRFIVSPRYKGGYKWEFPSAPGTMSVGFPKGTDSIPDPISKGARNMPIGRLPSITTHNCCLVGDAASLGNPLCFGGIGVGMLSARKAVRAMHEGDLARYQGWVDHDRMFSRHFMEAHRMFMDWDEEEIADAMVPFHSGYSVLRGAMAIARRPKWRHVYVSCWMGFSKGW